MASAELLQELVRAHFHADEDRFRNVLTQIIASESRAGHRVSAARLRDLVDQVKGHAATAPTPIARPAQELSQVLDIRYSRSRLSDMVLAADLRSRIERVLVEQRANQRLREHGLQPRRKLLLHGPPGCGKTMAASVLAGELRLPLVRVRLEVLFSKYLGATAGTLTDIFVEMSRTRGVYLFDEFDALGKQRSDDLDVGEMKRVVGTFLQLLDTDESDSLIVAATNQREALDRALFRRFDDVLSFPGPTPEDVRDLLRKLVGPRRITGRSVAAVDEAAAGLSFADVRVSVDEAKKNALLDGRDAIAPADLVAALAERKARGTH